METLQKTSNQTIFLPSVSIIVVCPFHNYCTMYKYKRIKYYKHFLSVIFSVFQGIEFPTLIIVVVNTTSSEYASRFRAQNTTVVRYPVVGGRVGRRIGTRSRSAGRSVVRADGSASLPVVPQFLSDAHPTCSGFGRVHVLFLCSSSQ